MKKRKRKHWTTKNTHLRKAKKTTKKKNKSLDDMLFTLAFIIFLGIALLSILYKALNNSAVGYDAFIGMPQEWIKFLRP